MTLRKIIFSAALLLAALTARAQYDASVAHYFAEEPAYNAAAVGKESKLNVAASYALDMAGFEHNPRTMRIGADLPLYAMKTYHGVGLQLLNDQIGLFTHQRFALQYALKSRLLGGTLSVGVQAGFLNEDFDGTKLDAEDMSDPALASSSVKGNSLDLGAGLYYRRGQWYAGLSAQHLNAPTIELGETNELKVDATYYFTAGYNIRLRNPFLTIKPSVLVRNAGTEWREDITARLVYSHEKRHMYLGVGYSPATSVSVYVGGQFHGVMLGYSYEMYTSAINPGNGSHALFVGYQTDINLVKKGRNYHQSVRIL